LLLVFCVQIKSVCEERLSLVNTMDKEPKPDNDVAASSADTEFTAPDVKPDSMTRKYYEV